MDIKSVLFYGHMTVLNAVDRLPESAWEIPGVCGEWSVKDIIAHLASYERLLVDVLTSFVNDSPTPTLERYIEDRVDFNDIEVARRASMSVQKVMEAYEDACAETFALLDMIMPQRLRQRGALPWYGEEYDLEDYLVNSFYGHKREHCAQIAAYRDSLMQDAYSNHSMERASS